MRRGVAAAGDRSSTGNAAELRLMPRTVSESRVPSGVPGLDDLVGGGFPRHRTVLLCGDIGTGKTTFGLQFLMAGVDRGEAGVLVSVDEKPHHVIEDARRFGWDLDAAINQRLLTVLDASPFFMALRSKSALDARHVAGDLTQQVRHATASRLVIDGVTSLAPAGAGDVASDDFIRSLVLSLEDNLDCTTVLTTRTTAAGAHPSAVGSTAEQVTSGVIELKLAPVVDLGELAGCFPGWRRRSLRIRKMRGAPSAIDERPFDIADGCGLVLRGHC
jgi:circadian clock protein KaiC